VVEMLSLSSFHFFRNGSLSFSAEQDSYQVTIIMLICKIQNKTALVFLNHFDATGNSKH
jgi:hypothetical protein